MTLPNFLIIGQIKAGTTSLYSYLDQHPDIYMSPLKEPRFFAFDASNPDHVKKIPRVFRTTTITEYKDLFKNAADAIAIGEASSNYFDSPIAPPRINDCLPGVKLIVSLRDYADRLYSGHLMNIRNGTEDRPFIDAFREGVDNHAWGIRAAFAYENLKRYLDVFGNARIRVILFEELINETDRVTKEIYDFLRVDSSFSSDTTKIHNKGGLPKFSILHKAYRLSTQNRRFKDTLKNLMPETLVNSAKSVYRQNLQKTSPLQPGDRQEVVNFYRKDILKLQDLINRDLSRWLQ